MRYLLIREDGIIVGEVSSHMVNAIALPKPGPAEPMILSAINSPGKKVKLYCIEPPSLGAIGKIAGGV